MVLLVLPTETALKKPDLHQTTDETPCFISFAPFFPVTKYVPFQNLYSQVAVNKLSYIRL